jgi:hypothetical protein
MKFINIEKDEKDEVSKTKPPLGIRPRHLVDLTRVQEICDAIVRYKAASINVPYKWLEELTNLVSE